MTEPAAFSFRRIFLVAFGPSLLFGVGEGAILPVLALSVRDLGGSVAYAALVVTLIGIGSLVFNLPASWIAARWGERACIVGASVASALALLVCAAGHSLFALSAGTFVIGMASAVFNLARQKWLTEAVPFRYRARALSTLGGVMRIGLFVGPFAGAATIPFAGLAGSYLAGAAAVAIAGVIAWRLPDLEAAAAASAAGGGPPLPGATPPPRASFGDIARRHRRVFCTVGVGVVLIAAVRASRQAVVPLWGERLGLDAATVSLIYGLASGVDMLVFYPAGRVMDLKGRNWVAVPSMLIMGAAFLAIPLTHDRTTLLAASLLLGFGNGIGSGMVMTLGADYSPAEGRAHFLGLWRLMSDIGATLGPAMLSAVTAAAALGPAIVASGGLALLAAALLGYWIPRTPRA